MSMSDPVADLLTRIRNAVRAGLADVEIPASKLKGQICRVLKEEGFIGDVAVQNDTTPGTIRLDLKYTKQNQPVLQGIRRVSKPSLRVYVPSGEIKNVRSGLGISILSTSKGVMTGKRARQEKIGGEVLCEAWER
jgi:small subunit ribosomal protein S8